MSLEPESCNEKRFDTFHITRKSFTTTNAIHSYIPSEISDTTKQRAGITNLLEAALAVKFKYIATLHESLFKFLDDLTGKNYPTLFRILLQRHRISSELLESGVPPETH